MLETVREYTAELLEASGEGAEIRLRHAEFFTRHAERLGLEMSDDAVLTLAEDEGNLRSALSFSSGGREPEVMLRLAGALGRYWENRCQFHEARGWLEEAVRQGQSCSTWARARALHNLAFVKGSLWDFAAARIVLGEALRLSTEVGDDNGADMCLSQLGWLAIGESNLELAETL